MEYFFHSVVWQYKDKQEINFPAIQLKYFCDQAPGDQAPGDQAEGDQAPGDQAAGDQAEGDQAAG